MTILLALGTALMLGQPFLEAAVGLALIAVGIWAVRATRNLHLHPPAEHGDTRITAAGLIHGLAGTSAVVALVPVTLAREPWLGLADLVAFGVGVAGGGCACSPWWPLLRFEERPEPRLNGGAALAG